VYEKFYKLKSRPFQLMPDPRLLFESRNHKRALDYLIYGLERREGFVVITGDVGTGKTLLLQTMLTQISVRHLQIARVAMANLDAESVVAAVAGAFGLPQKSRSKFELLDALIAKLGSGRNKGSLLIVDEAQACTVEALEELRAISNLQAGGQALVQVILVGQTELRDLLHRGSMAHLRQRIVASHHLLPLEADEVPQYVLHRLDAVGWQAGRPNIARDIFDPIMAWSRGIPRRINLIMDRLMVYGFLEEKMYLGAEDVAVVIEEFQSELGGDELALDEHSASAQPQADDERASERVGGTIDALNDRIAALERSLRNAYGDERARMLLARHEGHVEEEALVSTMLRLDRIERAMSDAAGQQYSVSGSPGASAHSDQVGSKTSEQEPPIPSPPPADAPSRPAFFGWGRQND